MEQIHFTPIGRSLAIAFLMSLTLSAQSYGQTDFLADPQIITPDGLSDELGGLLEFDDSAQKTPSKANIISPNDQEPKKPKSASSAILAGTIKGLSDKEDGIQSGLKGTVQQNAKETEEFEKATGTKASFGWKMKNMIENAFFKITPLVIEKVVVATISVLLARITA